MGFWAGVAKGVDSIEAQRNLENERSDRKDATAKADARYEAALTIDAEKWKNTLAQQDYRVKQDALAITREDARFESNRLLELAKEGIPVAGSGGTRSSGSSNTSGTTTAGTTKQDLTHTLQQLVSYGAKDAHLLNIAGGGNQVAADSLSSYEKLNELAKKDGNEIDVNEFLETAVMVTTPGEKFDLEKVAASLGISMDEVKSQAGLEAILVKRFTEKDMSTARFTYNYEAPMELEDYNRYTDTIKGNMVDEINNEIKVLRDSGDNPGRLERLNTAVNSLKGDNPSYSLAFDVLGDEAILPFVGNAAFMNANFGGDIQRAKERYLANQDSNTLPDEGIQDGSVANVLAQYGMTDADLPRFTQEEYDTLQEDPGTPYIYLNGKMLANKSVLNRGPQGQVDPATPEGTVADPAAVQTDEVFGEPSVDRLGVKPAAAPPEVSQPGDPVSSPPEIVSDGISFNFSKELDNGGLLYVDDRGNSTIVSKEEAAQSAGTVQPIPADARPDPALLSPPSSVQEEDGQLLLDYLQDDSTPPEMLDAMSDEFEKTYGFQALRDLLATLN